MGRNLLLSVSGASKSLGVSEAALRQWTDEGKIKAFVTPGGHRRYSQAELKRFMSAHRKVLGIKDLVAEIEGSAEMHREIFRASMTATRWYDKLDKESRKQLANLGRHLLDVVVEYIAQPARRGEILGEARESGRSFGETLAGLGLILTDSVEAFILHRDPLTNAATHLMSKKEALSGRVVEAIPMVGRVMDEALVSLVNAYQQHNSHERKNVQ